MMIGLQHFGPDKHLRDRLSEFRAVRDHYRTGFAVQGIGLIECNLLDLGGLQAVGAIGKIILQPTHAAYVGTLALPLPEDSYVFNVGAEEIGISGVRDTAIFIKTSTELEAQGYVPDVPEQGMPMLWKHPQTGTEVRWAQDPYEPAYEGPCLRNLADAPEHDGKFPEHPLSRVRFALNCLVQGVTLPTEVKSKGKQDSQGRS